MSYSFWLSLSPDMPSSKLNLLALPRWVELSLEAANQTVDQVAASSFDFHNGSCEDYKERAGTIMSEREFGFHNHLTDLLDNWLFPNKHTQEDFGTKNKLYDELVRAWHGMPLCEGLELNLHPAIVGPNTIALKHSGEIPGVTDVNLYERLLRCIYTLSVNRIGMHAFDSDLFKGVLSQHMRHQQAVATV